MEKTISNIGKERACGFRIYRDILAVEDGFLEHEVYDKPVDVVRSEDSLFASIFTVNPVTKLPDGDLAMYMSDKTSPEVRMFIEQNLMRDLGESSPVDSKDLSDDDIVKYARKHNESDGDYRKRIYDTLVSDLKSDSKKSDGV